MDRLRCLEVFAEVARAGSFTAAAQRYALSRSSVSKHVAWLEAELGAQLLARTTKEVGLTDAGHRLLEGSVQLLERFEELQAEVRDAVDTPRGVIRIGTPHAFGVHHLLPLALRFMAQHPDIQIAIEADDGRSSLVAERLDLSVRIAPALDDASFVAQSLLKAPQVLVAAPNYLQRAGLPRSVAELARHECLVHTLKSPTAQWRFTSAQGDSSNVRVRGALCSSLGEMLHKAALAGRGLAIHPTYMVADDLASGRLVNVLPQTPPLGLDIYVIYPARTNLPRRVRAFIDFLREWAASKPQWSVMPSPASSTATHPAAAA